MTNKYSNVMERNQKLMNNAEYQKLSKDLNAIKAFLNSGNVSLDEICEGSKEIDEIRSKCFKIEAQIDSEI